MQNRINFNICRVFKRDSCLKKRTKMSETNEEVEVLVQLIKTRDVNLLSRKCSLSPKTTAQLLTYRDTQGNSAFHHAVASGHLDSVKLLLKMGADSTRTNDYGWSPLCVAAFHGYSPVIKYLIENTSQYLNAASVFAFTPLMCAVYNGRYNTCKLLIDSGTSYLDSGGPGSTGQGTGLTPLMFSCLKGYFRISKLLLERGAEHNTQCQLNGWTALMFASNGSTKRSKTVEKVSKDNICDEQEKTTSKIEIVELLLNFGTDISLKNWSGKTAIDIAIETNQKEIADILKRFQSHQDIRKPKSIGIPNSESNLSLHSNGYKKQTRSAHTTETDVGFEDNESSLDDSQSNVFLINAELVC